MKKTLCLLFSLLLLTMCVSALAQEETIWDFDSSNWKLNDYTGPGGDVVIPAMIDNSPVETIAVAAINGNSSITSLVLPDTLKYICSSAVSYCENMTSVTLPEGLLFIGDNCFNGSAALESLTIPASVCYIGDSSFISLDGITSITFEGLCPYFSGYAFDWLPEQAVVYVPEDQFNAYADAFEKMDVFINLQSSGKAAVVCEYVTDPSLFDFDPSTGTVTSYNGADLRVDIPAEINGVPVKNIDSQAFYDNPYLVWVTIPEGVENIGDMAFESCNELLHIEFPSTLRTIGERAFAEGISTASLELPNGLESIGAQAFMNAYYLQKGLELPQGLKFIGDQAFVGCSWLSELYISDTVEIIGTEAFADCGMSYVVFEGPVLPKMPEDVFSGCGYLADIDLHTKASKQDMLALQSIVDNLGLECRVWRMQNPDVDYIHDGLDVYENGVLLGYTGTQTHIRPWDEYDEITVTALGDGAFKGNTTIEYFAVCYNDAFTTIGAEAFADSAIAAIDLFDSVTTIGAGAFRNCANITAITIPESVTNIAADAFEGCTGLKKITILCDPSILTEGMLDSCTALAEICGPDTEALNIALYGLPEVSIICQPENVTVPEGTWGEISLEAEGTELTYAWYVMEPLGNEYILDEGSTGNSFGIIVDGSTELTEVYCVVTDKYGTSVTSDTAYFLVEEEELIPVPVGSEGDPYLGTWKGVSMEMEGYSMVFADLGIVMDFTFNADGTLDIFDGEYIDTGVWSVIDGAACIEGSIATIAEDGALYIDEDGARLHLVRSENEAEVPAEPAIESPLEMPDTSVSEPAVKVPAETPSDPAGETQSIHEGLTDVKYVCINATVEGYTLDASMLGGEYSLVFHENGTADFVVVGAAMPPLPWSMADNGNFIIDYYGTKMEAVWNETGFDMNYFDTMLMHFVPSD